MCGVCVLIPYHTQSWLVADGSPTPAAGLCQPEAVPGWGHHVQIAVPRASQSCTDQSKIKPFNSALNLKEKSLFQSTDTGKQQKSEFHGFSLAISTL